MVSSKKERGKQRRAAKSLAAANAGVSNWSHEKIVKSISNGHRDVTRYVANYGVSGISSEHSGVLSIVLDFLKRCENDTFDKVMADVGGNLPSPSLWIGILITASELEQSCRMQIAQNIGLLVRCMCADTKRVFFKSKKHWRESIVQFVQLITRMIHRANKEQDDENKMIVDTLLQHEGLLRSIVQWGFWEEEHRPDITKELKVDDSATIVEWGRYAITQLMALVEVYKDGDDYDGARKLLDTIGTTPIVSKEYDPSCMVSYTAGLIRRMKTNLKTINGFVDMQNLIRWSDCVDKGVITELVDFGINYTTNCVTAEYVTNISCDVIQQESNVKQWAVLSDTRVAFAIRAGLIEMCLSFMEQFGMHESFGNGEQNLSLSHNIATIFKHVYPVSLHMKSAKAIRSKKSKIEEELFRLETSEINSVKCRELLDMVRSILDINGAYCCRCNKLLERKDIKQCNGCNRMTYCSKACQREDWLNGGHNLACCNKSITDEQAGNCQFQGRCLPVREPESERNAAKLKALEINISMVQLKLFLDNAETILSQASSLGIPLCDCVVTFYLGVCPYSVKTKRYTEVFLPKSIKCFEDTRSSKNITCIYRSPICNGELLVSRRSPVIVMQRFYPHEWLSKKLQ